MAISVDFATLAHLDTNAPQLLRKLLVLVDLTHLEKLQLALNVPQVLTVLTQLTAPSLALTVTMLQQAQRK